jgi:thioredoxin reductase
MKGAKTYDVIIIGGSYAGLSAAMSLGRALRSVLIIDSGKPCNQQTPHSHNFITHDGHTPLAIATQAKQQVLAYDTVTFKNGIAQAAEKLANGGFSITMDDGEIFTTEKLVFATGMKDEMPPIKGFAQCWGITVLHCPYCHGYEVKQLQTGILANGDMAYELAKLINNWTDELTVYTNGPSTLCAEQTEKLEAKGISIVNNEIAELQHQNGVLNGLLFKDGSHQPVKAMYARPVMKQHCELPQQLGCQLTETGHISIDTMHRTTVKGIYAAGDSTTMMRSVALAVSGGNFAGAAVNKDLIEDRF